MASDPGSKVEEQPPALPVKQHRSHSSRCSSVESDSVVLGFSGLQHQNYAYNDVFPEPTDCHAVQCPIHQRYDPSRHQVRFFSDDTPPPIPKKRLARTLSLPGTNAPPFSPLSPQRQHLNFDNPLYMLAPVPNTFFHEELEEFNPVRKSPAPSLSLSQLSFDTPDEHLPCIFSTFYDQGVISQGIQHRHLLFLRSMAQSVDAGVLLQGEVSERDVSVYQPQDFLLCEGSEPQQIGGAVYYSLHSPKLSGRVLGLRVHKPTDETFSAHTRHEPLHVNVQHVIAHFQPSKTTRNDSSTVQIQDPSQHFNQGCTAVKPSGGGSTEHATDPVNINMSSVQSFLLKEHAVSVERDLPQATLEDFVQDSSSLQSTDCLDYDRQVCVLLLQILMASQHLHNHSASAPELKPQDIFLVWPVEEAEKGGNKLEQQAPEMKTSRLKEDIKWVKAEKKGKIQKLWRTHGSPRVVLTPLSSDLSLPHPLSYTKSKIGALIQYCLDPRESLTPLSMPTYRAGLLYLASLLQSESSRPQMADMVVMLQVLLWGPRISLYNHRCRVTTAAHNWLTVKRALLVMKLAERGLVQDQSALDWEDCMCLQYLSFTDPEAVGSVANQLWLSINAD